ncbi:hypothetical protein QVD99_000298 [Batrachochytrium dendrobatidis]|nr:hypothetical protein QVD99_000298 [Batrachochytrium dendrobatidis]
MAHPSIDDGQSSHASTMSSSLPVSFSLDSTSVKFLPAMPIPCFTVDAPGLATSIQASPSTIIRPSNPAIPATPPSSAFLGTAAAEYFSPMPSIITPSGSYASVTNLSVPVTGIRFSRSPNTVTSGFAAAARNIPMHHHRTSSHPIHQINGIALQSPNESIVCPVPRKIHAPSMHLEVPLLRRSTGRRNKLSPITPWLDQFNLCPQQPTATISSLSAAIASAGVSIEQNCTSRVTSVAHPRDPTILAQHELGEILGLLGFS